MALPDFGPPMEIPEVPGPGGGIGAGPAVPPSMFPFAGGEAPGFAGFPQSFDFGGEMMDSRRRRMGRNPMAFTGMNAGPQVRTVQAGGRQAAPTMGFNPAARGLRPPSGGAAPGPLQRIGPGQLGRPQGAGAGPDDWVMQGGPWATIQELLKYGFLGPGSSGKEGFGGVFSVNPPSEIMGGVRSRAIQDAGAQERAARLGLQSRGDMDPSTYGFQALQSQLQGQQGVNRALGEADLGLRQQQLENYWRLLNNLLGAYGGIEGAKYGQPKKQSGLGGLLGGIGGLIGGIRGGGGGGGGGAGSLYEYSGGQYL